MQIMALLTVERSQSVEGFLSSSEESDDSVENEDFYSIDPTKSGKHSSRHPKLGRLRSPSFAGYFASRGGAVSLPDGISARTASPAHIQSCGDLQIHLQTMVTLLREQDTMKMAVRIESQLPDKKRFLTLVTSENDESLLIGIDWANGPTIGLVLELSKTTIAKLDGDGGFHISSSNQKVHCFKPVSVQTLWSAMHVIQRGVEMAAKHTPDNDGYQDFVSFYQNKIDSDPTSISEWNMMNDLLSTRQFDLVLSEQEESEQAYLKKLIRSKLKEVMIKVDLDVITSRQIRNMCEEELDMDLSEFKSYIDTEMFTILGQMDSASKIFDYLYLGSEWNASDLEELKSLGIGYILNLTREIDNFFPDTFAYLNVRVYDEEDTQLLPYWDHTYKFINKAKRSGSKVLVHCRRGISRSASTVIAYAMKSRSWSLKESLEFVKDRRSIVEPNAGFQKQLIIYEGILNSSRNRYNALFRQRSKSEREPSSAREKRRLFRSSRSNEIHDEVAKDNREEIENIGDNSSFNPKRPKSWAYETSSGEQYSNNNTTVIKNPPEMPALIEDPTTQAIEEPRRSGDENAENSAGKNIDIQDGRKQAAKHRRKIMSRAKTLPCQTARHWEINNQSDTRADKSNEAQVTEAKEEVLVEQAVAASIMKGQLLRSLVQLQEKRGTREFLDNKFSVESIIKPSSLRKISLSRKLPFERRKSFTEDTEVQSRHKLRKRAMTVGPTRYFEPDDKVSSKGDNNQEQENRYEVESKPVAAEGDGVVSIALLSSLDSSTELENQRITNVQQDDSEKDISTLDRDVARHDQKLMTADEGMRVPSTNGEQKDDNCIQNENLDSNIPQRPYAEGVDCAERCVDETSQFKTVKESAMVIEERTEEHRSRLLRLPRRHTIGECKAQEEELEDFLLQRRSKSTESRNEQRVESPSPVAGRTKLNSDNGEAFGYVIAPKKHHIELPTEALAVEVGHEFLNNKQLRKKEYDVLNVPSQATSTDESSLDANNPYLVDCDSTEPALKGTDDQNVSVRDLVEKHSELIRQKHPGDDDTSTSNLPLNASTIGKDLISYSESDLKCANSDGKAVNDHSAIDDYCMQAKGELKKHQKEEDGYQTEDAGNKTAENNEIVKTNDVVQPGIVKRQSLLLAKAFGDETVETMSGDFANLTCASETSGSCPDTSNKEAESQLEKDTVKAIRPKRNSVKERLQQLENLQKMSSSSQNRSRRLISLNFDEPEQESSAQMFKEQDPTTEHETQNTAMLSPVNKTSLSKSAPCSPKIKKHSQDNPSKEDHMLKTRHKDQYSSIDELYLASILNEAEHIGKVFSNVSPSERPCDDVRSLVDRFEEQ